jgi:hypothetical protein
MLCVARASERVAMLAACHAAPMALATSHAAQESGHAGGRHEQPRCARRGEPRRG